MSSGLLAAELPGLFAQLTLLGEAPGSKASSPWELPAFLRNVTLFCFLASYAVTAIFEALRLVRRTTVNRFIRVGFALAGLLAHTAYLYGQSQKANLPPLLSSSHDWMLVLAWLAMLFYILLTTFDRDLAVGPFLLPVVLVFIVASNFVSKTPNSVLDAAHGWKMLHATLLVLGTAGVIVGFVLSLMYLVQHRRLKHKQSLVNGLTLPNLESLARWNWWAVVISVPLLTMGMATGVGLGWHARKVQPLSFTDPVIVGNGVGWLVMAVFFAWLVLTRRPKGKQVAWLTVLAFGFLLVTVISLQMLSGTTLDTWHTQQPLRSTPGVAVHNG